MQQWVLQGLSSRQLGGTLVGILGSKDIAKVRSWLFSRLFCNLAVVKLLLNPLALQNEPAVITLKFQLPGKCGHASEEVRHAGRASAKVSALFCSPCCKA